ncbi:hypothetical protein ASPVEDRAFT_145964 [Aspergillus versicolor CBS 583.65]|uniref:Uncharacterized protein n=1 Tax=Aspergillus versicolor CBS 583.65 TaxID=1036611 RepID=A0A1L9P4L5_ASPVE|nr:uncharacterized protein ASPVEDRAFT_145964 [Aspergillus versicolor CBS 583.65]OJI96467.1 hypothetical protein ASPVEDRAFT_145964 [Aspergillus versicolor CBS 583.65]
MAIPFPEGKAYFKRSALKSEKDGRFNADDPAHFYSTMIVEMTWNVEAHHGSKQANEPKGHPHKRSNYEIYPSRRVQCELCTSGYRFKRHEYGDKAEVWFMFVPMPTREEEWIWMDRLTRVRAIYIPTAYSSSESYPDICTYVHVNFTKKAAPTMVYQKPSSAGSTKLTSTTVQLKSHSERGLDIDKTTTLGINPARLITALIIPEDIRKVDAYTCGGLALMDTAEIPNAVLQREYDSTCMADWAVVVNENHGVQVGWKKADMGSPWFLEYFKNAVAFAIGYVPIVGPFATIGWNLAISGIFDDHEAFMEELREQIPSYQLLEGFVEEIQNIVEDGKPMIKDKVSLKKKKDEKDYVVFDEKVLADAKKTADAKAKDKPTTVGEESIFKTLSLSILMRLALDNRFAILKLLNEPKVDDEDMWSPEALRSDTRSATIVTRLPLGDQDELVDALERLSTKGEVKYNEGWKLMGDVPKNGFGVHQAYVKKQAGRYIKAK